MWIRNHCLRASLRPVAIRKQRLETSLAQLATECLSGGSPRREGAGVEWAFGRREKPSWAAHTGMRMDEKELRELIAAVKTDRVSRRTFTRMMVGLGLTPLFVTQLRAHAGLAQSPAPGI